MPQTTKWRLGQQSWEFSFSLFKSLSLVPSVDLSKLLWLLPADSFSWQLQQNEIDINTTAVNTIFTIHCLSLFLSLLDLKFKLNPEILKS